MSESKCLSCKKCIADPEVGYECGLNVPGNWIHTREYQTGDKSCPDFELDLAYITKQINNKYAVPEDQAIEVLPKLKNYCIIWASDALDTGEKLISTKQKFKQKFIKLPEDSANKLKELFEGSKEFWIE